MADPGGGRSAKVCQVPPAALTGRASDFITPHHRAITGRRWTDAPARATLRP